MRLTLRATNTEGVNTYLAAFGNAAAVRSLTTAVGSAGIRVQRMMRENLESMIYAQSPAPGGYIRTRTLYRSVHASPPDTQHGGDESRASSGGDLAAQSASQAAGAKGDQLISEVGSWISYSEFVHNGVNQPQARPFMKAAEPAAATILREEIAHAVRALAHRRGP